MRVSCPVWAVVLTCLPSFGAAQQSDQVMAERVLGSQWKQVARRAGMIFAGTVLTATTQTVTTQAAVADRAVLGTARASQLSFRVDEPIAGVERGQILTVHEWAGAWSMQRPMRGGQHILIFLYPPSHLGLTSLVGGALGQIALDASGKNVLKRVPEAAAPAGSRNESSQTARLHVGDGTASVVQLKRAIRSAREE